MNQAAKLQRWMDLVTTLLDHHFGVTLAQLRGEVPGYRTGKEASVRRTFERDKDELRALGVPIETVGTSGDAETAYRIPTDRFYLPYLSVVTARGRTRPRRVDRYGYQALRECDFTDADLLLLAEGAARLLPLGDTVLAADARGALAKLAVDVPGEHLTATPGVIVVGPIATADPHTLTLLGDALVRRKSVTFTYYGIERDETERRTVLPYGLTCTSGHWYLHGFDPARGAARRFRISRVRELRINPKQPTTPDYEVPASFHLGEVAEPVPAWELGDEPVTKVTLRFRSSTGRVRVARTLGRSTSGDRDVIRFAVRRREPFLRFVLSLAGDAEPLAPPDIVREYHALVGRTRATLEGTP